jgi:Dyp-type peroxidase family
MPEPTARLGPSVAAVRDCDFNELQGNILSGYRLPYGAFLLVRITNSARGRDWLQRHLTREPVTTARAQKRRPAHALNVAFTFAGLRALDVPEELLRPFPDDFRQGMQARAKRLGDVDDNDPQGWEPGLRDADGGHVMLMLRAKEKRVRDAAVTRERRLIRRHRLAVVYEELSNPLPLPDDAQKCGPGDREHFGFADGCSQPAIAGTEAAEDDDYQRVKAGEILLGYLDEDDMVPGAATFFRNGSFMVFRKLEQRVAALNKVLAENADALHKDEAREKIVGRRTDGTPLVLPRQVSRDRKVLNNFRYGSPSDARPNDAPPLPSDPEGLLCPLGAHIRRAFPRDALVGGDGRTKRHRILRRGMPYGTALPADDVREGESDTGRGLLFTCFNASIARQFEIVQSWCLDGNLFDVPGEPDFLLGPATATMTIPLESGARVLRRDRPLVVTRGGAYFFYPSAPALKAIAEADYLGQVEPLPR